MEALSDSIGKPYIGGHVCIGKNKESKGQLKEVISPKLIGIVGRHAEKYVDKKETQQ